MFGRGRTLFFSGGVFFGCDNEVAVAEFSVAGPESALVFCFFESSHGHVGVQESVFQDLAFDARECGFADGEKEFGAGFEFLVCEAKAGGRVCFGVSFFNSFLSVVSDGHFGADVVDAVVLEGL